MAGRFLDSSAVAKFYHAEVGSAAVEQIVLDPAASIFISRLSVVEVQSVFAGKVRAGVISARDVGDLRRRFFEDVANGLFRIVALTSEHYEKAGELIERYGASHGLRTLDSLQLAVALDLPWKTLWPPTRLSAKLPQSKECQSSIRNSRHFRRLCSCPKPPGSIKAHRLQQAARNLLKRKQLKTGRFRGPPKAALGAGVGSSNMPAPTIEPIGCGHFPTLAKTVSLLGIAWPVPWRSNFWLHRKIPTSQK